MSQISIIGTRSCGKTTYLAALAHFSHQNKYPGLNVIPIDDAKELVGMAKNIIARGQPMPPNRKEENRRKYEFDIELPKLTKLIRLVVKDSSGELFDMLVKDRKYWSPDLKGSKENNKDNPGFVEELCQATGWIIMTDWIDKSDERIYLPAIANLLYELSLRETKYKNMQKKRIAVVMAKCERGEAWTGRLDPGEDIFRLRMPETYKELQKKIYLPRRIGFFACSSFGVLGDKDPRPNRLIGDNDIREYAYLMEKNKWRPYGLFSPIYWLIKGRRYEDESL